MGVENCFLRIIKAHITFRNMCGVRTLNLKLGAQSAPNFEPEFFTLIKTCANVIVRNNKNFSFLFRLVI